MSILVVGSVAFDSIRTPFADKTDLLGGSATHFSIAASFFSRVRLVAVVGEDFGDEHMAPFHDHNVDVDGLQRVPGKTFRWAGEYGEDPNNRTTLDTQLNVFADFRPELPEAWLDTPVVFLANIDPELQWQVLEQVRAPEIVAADTMNFWIDSKRDALVKTLGRVGILLINDSETRDLTGKTNVFEAADEIRAMGPEVVVIKRGEHGVIVADPVGVFVLPAFPVRRVMDPTGAGDSFAGGFLGYLVSRRETGERDYRCAAVAGTIMASFQVEEFSLDRLRRLTSEEILGRYREFRDLTKFQDLTGL